MERYEIERLRELPMRRVLGSLGVDVDERGLALCPLHDDRHKGSFVINKGRNLCSCYSCGRRNMDTIGITMAVLGKTFPEACRWLAERNGVILGETERKVNQWGQTPVIQGNNLGEKERKVNQWGQTPVIQAGREQDGGLEQMGRESRARFDAGRYRRFFERPVLTEAAWAFLRERRVREDVVRWYRLNSYRDRHGVDWLQLPYYDVDGRLVGVQSRRLTKDVEGPRFRFPAGSRSCTFGMQIIPFVTREEELFIVEGSSDLLALASSGRKGIAVASATLLRREDFGVLKERGLLRWHMFHDNDEPGRALRDQVVRLANEMGASIVAEPAPDGCKDFGEWWMKARG